MMASTREIIVVGIFDDTMVSAKAEAKYHFNIFDKFTKFPVKMFVFCVRPASTQTCTLNTAYNAAVGTS